MANRFIVFFSFSFETVHFVFFFFLNAPIGSYARQSVHSYFKKNMKKNLISRPQSVRSKWAHLTLWGLLAVRGASSGQGAALELPPWR
jgi:hypothetical protein